MTEDQAPPKTPAPGGNQVPIAPTVELKIDLLHCPCGEPPGQMRMELPGKGAKIGQVRGSCCGVWAVEFINNTDNPEQSLKKAITVWNAAPRAMMAVIQQDE